VSDRDVSDGRTYTYTWSNRGQTERPLQGMTVELALSIVEGWTNGYAVRTFSYDDAGRMTEATVFTLTTKFTYNGDGVRLAVEVVGQGTTTYTVDYGGGYRVLAEENIAGTLLYLYGRECLGQYDGEWLYYLDDATGYVRQGTDDQGAVVSAWLFDPDGLVLEGPEGPVSRLMCRGMYDWSTGLIYKDQRYFDPTLGIWLALAPLVVIQSWRGRKRKRSWYPWYVVVICVMGVGGMLVGCTGTPTGTTTNTPTGTATNTATSTATAEAVCTNTYTPSPTTTNTPTGTPTTIPTGTPTATPTSTPTHTPTPTDTPTPTPIPGPLDGDQHLVTRRDIVVRKIEELIPGTSGSKDHRVLLLGIAYLESRDIFENSDAALIADKRTPGGIMQVTSTLVDTACWPDKHTYVNTEQDIKFNVACGVDHFYGLLRWQTKQEDRLNTLIEQEVKGKTEDDTTWRVVAAVQWYTGAPYYKGILDPDKRDYLQTMAYKIRYVIPKHYPEYAGHAHWAVHLDKGYPAVVQFYNEKKSGS
jgi:hypothetical protein